MIEKNKRVVSFRKNEHQWREACTLCCFFFTLCCFNVISSHLCLRESIHCLLSSVTPGLSLCLLFDSTLS